jgi:hypothetical protein
MVSTYLTTEIIVGIIVWLIIAPFVVCCFLDWIQNDKKYVYRFFLHATSGIMSLLLGVELLGNNTAYSEGGLPLTPWIVSVGLAVMLLANISCWLLNFIELGQKMSGEVNQR